LQKVMGRSSLLIDNQPIFYAASITCRMTKYLFQQISGTSWLYLWR
jgi:hypothetical protein